MEAVASTGGQLMPPIMGTAAFLMAELSGVGYLAVMKAGFFPALLYYFSLFVMIHFEAKSNNIGYLDPKLVPPVRQVLCNLYYLLPIIILIASMLQGRSITVCANIATLSVLVLSFFRKETRFTPKVFVDSLNKSAVNSQGWLLRRCTVVERVILMVAGVSLIYPGLMTDVIGVSGLCGVGLLQWLHNRRDPLPQVTPAGMTSAE